MTELLFADDAAALGTMQQEEYGEGSKCFEEYYLSMGSSLECSQNKAAGCWRTL